jgi:uroporphyrinogen decarboxylase
MEGLSSKERVLLAIRHKEPDVVPVSPRIDFFLQKYYGCACWEHMLKAAEEFDFDPIVELGPRLPNYLYWSPTSYPDIEGVSVRSKFETLPDESTIVEREIITPAGHLTDKSKLSTGSRFFLKARGDVQRLEHMIKGPEDLDKLRYLLPDPSAKRFQDIKEITENVGDMGLVEVTVHSAIDHKAGAVYPPTRMMEDYYLNRGFVVELLRMFHEYTMAETKAYLESGAETIHGSWYWASLSVGWSPKIYDDLFAPLIKEHVRLVHDYGAIYHFYDDGKCMPILELLKDAKVDVIDTLTPPPMGDVNLAEAKRRIGDTVCLKGYIDLYHVIQKGTPELIANTVREAIDIAAPGGGFILGTSDSIRAAPVENVRAYFNAGRKFGRYPIRRY